MHKFSLFKSKKNGEHEKLEIKLDGLGEQHKPPPRLVPGECNLLNTDCSVYRLKNCWV